MEKSAQGKKMSTEPPQEFLSNNIKRIKGPTKQIFKTIKCREKANSKDFLVATRQYNKKEVASLILKPEKDKAT